MLPTTQPFAEASLGDIATCVGVFGGLVAFAVGLLQYSSAQAWKRAEFVAQEMAKFLSQAKVSTALLLLDYNHIRLNPDGSRAADGTGIHFDDQVCADALRSHKEFKDQGEKFGPDQMIAREAFDAFLTGLDMFGHYLKTGLVNAANLEPYLGYWVRNLQNPAWKTQLFHDRLQRFVRDYGYSGVQHLSDALTKLSRETK